MSSYLYTEGALGSCSPRPRSPFPPARTRPHTSCPLLVPRCSAQCRSATASPSSLPETPSDGDALSPEDAPDETTPPHIASSPIMWWDAARIEATVTRQFVCNHLLPEEIERLDRSLGFGDDLTDGTYWEWISEKAKRIFLILVDLDMPDQIFGVIDDSWDDGDLPIALDSVGKLALTAARDERCERRFYQRQFHYLLRPLQKGEHLVYHDPEVVPLDVPDRKQAHLHHHPVDRVTIPGEPGRLLSRRRIPIGPGPGQMAHDELRSAIDGIRKLQNDHLVSYWGSYAHQGNAYVLFGPAPDLNLKAFLAATPPSVKMLDKQARRLLVLNWIDCLVDTLCFIHNRGLSHGKIKPSTVLFSTDENRIFFSDFSRLGCADMQAGDKSSFDKESYDYAAPEQWFRPSAFAAIPGPQQQQQQQHHPGGRLSLTVSTEASTTFSISRRGVAADGHHAHPQQQQQQQQHYASAAAAGMHAPNPQLNPQAADVFSLGCIILELLGFLLKRQTRAFATHRAARHKMPGRGGAVPDSSFHRNLGQVEAWMTAMARDATKHDDPLVRGVAPMLHVVERMLAMHPSERPSAHDVQMRMYQILTADCGVSEPHCVHRYGGWDYNIGGLKLSPTTTAASAATGFAGTAADRDSIVIAKRSSSATACTSTTSAATASGSPAAGAPAASPRAATSTAGA